MFSKEQHQFVPVLKHVADRLAEAAVGLDLVLIDLLGEPGLEFIHLQAALSLMELQPLLIRHPLAFGLGIIRVNVLEDLQDIQGPGLSARSCLARLSWVVAGVACRSVFAFFAGRSWSTSQHIAERPQ